MNKIISRIQNKKILIPLIAMPILTVSLMIVNYVDKKRIKKNQQLITRTKDSISESIFNNNELVEEPEAGIQIEYTVRKDLMNYLEKLLKRYKSDYSAVVVIDNNNGDILGFAGHERKANSLNKALPFTSTHPGASLIKIVTAASLLEKEKFNPKEKLTYRGKPTTLYKYQLKDKRTRWTREQTFERAFAASNNVIFGKSAVNHLENHDLFVKAYDFGFNRQLTQFLDITSSHFKQPEDEYHRAQLASGLNSETMMSPIHAAVLSTVVANDGKLIYPALVKRIINKKEDKVLWEKEVKEDLVLNYNKNKYLKEMMQMTVTRGTARRLYRSLNKRVRKKLILGGKTGAMSGGIPEGKRDWLTIFAKPKDQSDKGISISVMNINKEKWYYKSTFIAKKIIEYYFR